MTDFVEIELIVHKETPKAILVTRPGDYQHSVWLPKSKISWPGDALFNIHSRIKFSPPEWLVSKHRILFEPNQQDRRPEPERQIGTPRTPLSPREIFGLDEGFDERELTSAHRKLMARVHPDVGGTDGLAKALNIWKNELMAGLRR
jgi:hypothetical protein